ncbi:MAG: flagellar assembly protein T N-terminal domain-containing protein [SAR324 cluster bacterium]|nr:flagellar assembly protein T N-terminal domain-containing protein [SAR324 cluster bacterium]
MKRKRKILPVMIMIAALFIPPALIQAAVIGKGQAKIFNNNDGSARNQALSNALRDAVKQGVGVLLDSNTIVKNWTVIQDEVYSSARGFVKTYKVIKDSKISDTWYVEIEAEVATGQLKDKLGELRILHKKMGNKRLMIIYNPENPDSLPEFHGAVKSALTSIPSEFNQSGFRIFDQRSLGHISDKISQTGGIKAAWMKIADEQQVDILTEFELISSKKNPFSNQTFTAAKVTLRMKTYDVSTGRLISNVQANQKQMTNARAGSFDWDNALAKASEKAGESVAIDSINNIVEFYKSVGDIGNNYLMIFKDFTEDETDIIIDTLENLEGYQSLSELQSMPNLIKIEYFSTMDKSRLRRKIRMAVKNRKIMLSSKEISGNRFVFVKQ